MSKMDVKKIIEELSKGEYPLFVSERHLQVAFSLKAKELYPDYELVPEYVYKKGKDIYHIDLICKNNKEKIAFEFKYVVAGGKIKVPGDDQYSLRNHSAIDIRRYQCVKDIERLEKYVNSNDLKCNRGYFILITNMHGFWNGSKSDSVAADFDIKHNTKLKKGQHVATGKGRFARDYSEPIKLKNGYLINYCDYVEVDGEHGLFKYLCVCVK